MNVPDFFRKDKCDRCGGPLTSRTMSWFRAGDTICFGKCAAEEHELKAKLRALGKNPADYENIGYLPEVGTMKKEVHRKKK